MNNRRRFLFIIPVLCGLFLFYSMVNNKKNPSRPEISERVRAVSIVRVQKMTVIRAPFDCRIAEVRVELDQYASAGATLLKAINISAVEIPVQLAPSEFVNLLSISPADGTILAHKFNMDNIRRIIGISATVRLPLFSKEAVWEAQFMRTGESIDLETGALTVYVAIQNPFDKIKPSERPPLMPNLYCEVELQGSPRKDRYVVPVHAIHDGYVYLIDGEKRLKRQNVTTEMIMKDMAIISEGLSDGNEVITTDLVPAIEGMLLSPKLNEELMFKINASGGNQL